MSTEHWWGSQKETEKQKDLELAGCIILKLDIRDIE
jgi:hypothetical protein